MFVKEEKSLLNERNAAFPKVLDLKKPSCSCTIQTVVFEFVVGNGLKLRLRLVK
jgi:hypothetical protein